LAIVDHLKQNPDSLAGKKVFPGIELRVESSHKDQRLNVHLVIDPDIHRQDLLDVLAILKVSLMRGTRSLSEACLIEYARELGADYLKKQGHDASKIASNDDYALEVGWKTAMVTPTSLQEALEQLGEKGMLLMPWDTYGGLREIDWVKHYTEVRRLRMAADIFECKDAGNRLAFHGVCDPLNKSYFDSFWDSLDKKARLCVRGTDAHSFANYGVFPSGMKTWIKAELTYQGLRHSIREPVFRSYIGELPPKQAFVEANGRLFMERIQVDIRAGANTDEKWFDGTDLRLNPDLVAIIGNKGSGKSGLAEVLALAGNSKSHQFFTFLVDHRFKNGSTQRAGNFKAILTWRNGDVVPVTLDQVAKADQPERVKYISQIYFEQLCNDHVAGRSDKFGAEIRKVLFSHLDPAERGSHQSLDDYLFVKEQPSQERIQGLRAELHGIGLELADLEKQTSTAHESELKEKKAAKELELRDLEAKKPTAVLPPPHTVSAIPTVETQRLQTISARITELDNATSAADANKRALTKRRAVVVSVSERLATLEQQVVRSNVGLQAELAAVDIEMSEVVTIVTKRQELDDLAASLDAQIAELSVIETARTAERGALQIERTLLQEKLDQPTRVYQQYVISLSAWEKAKSALNGSAAEADTIVFYQHLLDELSKVPERCRELEAKQDALLKAIHAELIKIGESRKPLFAPVEELVKAVPGVANGLRVGFQSGLFFDRATFAEKFFDAIKKSTGGFRGEEDGSAKLMQMLRAIDFNDADSVMRGMRAVRTAITGDGAAGSALLPILRSKWTSEQLYDLLFGLEHLEAKFSLSLAGTTIQQMSPGQRGALLLIFYLLVDTDPTPLILDQPEENLDNQTVYSMLVPIIQRAKERRQIIMVTHNANLAVCCDAEQIIYAEFDRANQYSLKYEAGAIESPKLNKAVLDVLEGTTPAFENRQDKYHH
jgi:ABC-type lipoprotein export system ATPase subunit